LEIDDKDLPHNVCTDVSSKTPVISGFVSLVKVFLCVLGIITQRPSNRPQISPPPLAFDERSFLSERFASSPPALRSGGFEEHHITHDVFQEMMDNLNRVVNDIPGVLRDLTPGNPSSLSSRPFDIMKANIHITKLYLQSVILERCSTLFQEPTSPGVSVSGYEYISSSDELWRSREDICRQLLSILNIYPVETLEFHGTSMVDLSSRQHYIGFGDFS